MASRTLQRRSRFFEAWDELTSARNGIARSLAVATSTTNGNMDYESTCGQDPRRAAG